MKQAPLEEKRLTTGVAHLDGLLNDGLPERSIVAIAGAPGAGKTILTQQIAFANAALGRKTLFLGTLSEPTAKTLRYLTRFSFFDEAALHDKIVFVDLGGILRNKGVEGAGAAVMAAVRKHRPQIVVIDSFKVFSELARSREEFRQFAYQLTVDLMAWECTALLVGEFGEDELASNPLFSVVDGVVVMSARELSGEQQRFIQVQKMRGTAHSRDEHPLLISSSGIEIYAPRVTITRGTVPDHRMGETAADVRRVQLGVEGLDDMLGPGIPSGSSVLIAGCAGTGKSVTALQILHHGAAVHGEKGVYFTYEETPERLLATARGLDLDLEPLIKKGLVQIHFVAQPDILVEADLLRMHAIIEAFQPARIVLDSVSVFLHKIKEPKIAREKLFQLTTLVQRARATGFFVTDIPVGSNMISRMGLEETVVDGIIMLSLDRPSLGRRERFVEIYKMRNTPHVMGLRRFAIGKGGLRVSASD